MAGFFGTVNPTGFLKYGGIGNTGSGLMGFANNMLKIVIAGAGLFAFINFILAGYTFLGAGGDPKKVQQAWEKIWQSLLGLLFVAASFVLAAVFGYLLFGDPMAILSPKIYGPGTPSY